MPTKSCQILYALKFDSVTNQVIFEDIFPVYPVDTDVVVVLNYHDSFKRTAEDAVLMFEVGNEWNTICEYQSIETPTNNTIIFKAKQSRKTNKQYCLGYVTSTMTLVGISTSFSFRSVQIEEKVMYEGLNKDFDKRSHFGILMEKYAAVLKKMEQVNQFRTTEDQHILLKETNHQAYPLETECANIPFVKYNQAYKLKTCQNTNILLPKNNRADWLEVIENANIPLGESDHAYEFETGENVNIPLLKSNQAYHSETVKENANIPVVESNQACLLEKRKNANVPLVESNQAYHLERVEQNNADIRIAANAKRCQKKVTENKANYKNRDIENEAIDKDLSLVVEQNEKLCNFFSDVTRNNLYRYWNEFKLERIMNNFLKPTDAMIYTVDLENGFEGNIVVIQMVVSEPKFLMLELHDSAGTKMDVIDCIALDTSGIFDSSIDDYNIKAHDSTSNIKKIDNSIITMKVKQKEHYLKVTINDHISFYHMFQFDPKHTSISSIVIQSTMVVNQFTTADQQKRPCKSCSELQECLNQCAVEYIKLKQAAKQKFKMIKSASKM